MSKSTNNSNNSLNFNPPQKRKQRKLGEWNKGRRLTAIEAMIEIRPWE